MSDITFIALEVQGRIKEIGDKLTQQDPLLPVHLAAIHSTCIQHEELVHLLSDEEIRTLVAGQQKHAGMQLVKEATVKKTAPKAVPRGQSISGDL